MLHHRDIEHENHRKLVQDFKARSCLNIGFATLKRSNFLAYNCVRTVN